ncbi:MAG: type II toxin-antitoxin system ParD family antitoxin [Mariprofundales bacterium]
MFERSLPFQQDQEALTMHISLTPVLESGIKSKVDSGLYNNASEVVREALRFMEENREIVQQIKLNHLRQAVAIGAKEAEQGKFSTRSVSEIIADANRSL